MGAVAFHALGGEVTPRKNGTARRQHAPHEDRFTYRTNNIGLAQRIRTARHVTNASISELIEWCVERTLEEFVKTHRPTQIKLRRGQRPKLAP